MMKINRKSTSAFSFLSKAKSCILSRKKWLKIKNSLNFQMRNCKGKKVQLNVELHAIFTSILIFLLSFRRGLRSFELFFSPVVLIIETARLKETIFQKQQILNNFYKNSGEKEKHSLPVLCKFILMVSAL